MVSGVCLWHTSIRRFAVIAINFRIVPGPGGSSTKDEWWSPRECRIENCTDQPLDYRHSECRSHRTFLFINLQQCLREKSGQHVLKLRYPSLVWSWIAIGSYTQSCKHPVCFALESSNLSLSATSLSNNNSTLQEFKIVETIFDTEGF